MKFDTKLLHGEYKSDENTGATSTPIYQTTSFEHRTAEELENIFAGREFGFIYSRLNNPTVDAFERRINALENGLGAIACSSGMSAITLSIMNIVKSGEEIISSLGIFGGTHSLFKNLEQFGIITKYTKDLSIRSFEELITNKTRVIFIETIGNPKLDIPNIKDIAELAHKYKIPLIVDNTVTTPYLINPIKLGGDIVIHSTSKYINGSGNSIGGIIIDSGRFNWDLNKYSGLKEYEKFGSFKYLAKLRKGLFKDFGTCLAPFNAYLCTIGLDTLTVRMDRICDNALKLAKALESNSNIVKVNYPGLQQNEYYNIAKEQFVDKYGGILTIRVGTNKKAYQVINKLRLAKNLANIGDVRTLVIHPASTIYNTNTLQEKESMGVYEDLIRISVGLEDSEDLITDFYEALE